MAVRASGEGSSSRPRASATPPRGAHPARPEPRPRRPGEGGCGGRGSGRGSAAPGSSPSHRPRAQGSSSSSAPLSSTSFTPLRAGGRAHPPPSHQRSELEWRRAELRSRVDPLGGARWRRPAGGARVEAAGARADAATSGWSGGETRERVEGKERRGDEEGAGTAKAREARPSSLLACSVKPSFWSFRGWENQTPFGGAWGFWSFLEKQKLQEAPPNRAVM